MLNLKLLVCSTHNILRSLFSLSVFLFFAITLCSILLYHPLSPPQSLSLGTPAQSALEEIVEEKFKPYDAYKTDDVRIFGNWFL
jgi:hypothetical protein